MEHNGLLTGFNYDTVVDRDVLPNGVRDDPVCRYDEGIVSIEDEHLFDALVVEDDPFLIAENGSSIKLHALEADPLWYAEKKRFHELLLIFQSQILSD